MLSVLAFAGCADDDKVAWPPLEQPTEGRTLIYYMVCDNDLSNYIYINLMQVAGVKIENPNDRVVAFIDHTSLGAVLTTEPQIVQFDGNGYHRILKTYPEGNSCDPAFFREVLDYITTAFPSQSYGLALSSHGSGWSYSPESAAKSFGGDFIDIIEDANGRRYMTNPQFINIKSIAEQLPVKFNFILFDACLMAHAEVAYELKDKADYLLASPITIAGKGFAYDTIQPFLLSHPDADLKSAADWFYNHYAANLANTNGAAISVIDLSQIAELAAVQSELFEKHNVGSSLLQSVKGAIFTDPDDQGQEEEEEEEEEEVIIDLLLNGKSFTTIQYYDEVWANRYRFDYLDFMTTILGEQVDPNDLKKLTNQLNKTVIYQRHTPRFSLFATVTNEKFVFGNSGKIVEKGVYPANIGESSGMSVYIPFAQFFDEDEQYIIDHSYYRQLGWYQAAGMGRLFSE